MAHRCPNCGIKCHCSGDIDDLIMPIKSYCYCCDSGGHYDDDDIGECDECGGCWGTHSTDCPNKLNANAPLSQQVSD